jgi:hypothetical protein
VGWRAWGGGPVDPAPRCASVRDAQGILAHGVHGIATARAWVGLQQRIHRVLRIGGRRRVRRSGRSKGQRSGQPRRPAPTAALHGVRERGKEDALKSAYESSGLMNRGYPIDRPADPPS